MPEEKAYKVKSQNEGPFYIDPKPREADLICLSVPDSALRIHGGKDGPAVVIETNGEEIDLVKHIKTTRALVWGLFFAMVPLALAVVLMAFQLS
jgi:hypothetical protein